MLAHSAQSAQTCWLYGKCTIASASASCACCSTELRAMHDSGTRRGTVTSVRSTRMVARHWADCRLLCVSVNRVVTIRFRSWLTVSRYNRTGCTVVRCEVQVPMGFPKRTARSRVRLNLWSPSDTCPDPVNRSSEAATRQNVLKTPAIAMHVTTAGPSRSVGPKASSPAKLARCAARSVPTRCSPPRPRSHPRTLAVTPHPTASESPAAAP